MAFGLRTGGGATTGAFVGAGAGATIGTGVGLVTTGAGGAGVATAGTTRTTGELTFLIGT